MKAALRDFYGEDPQRSADYGRIVNRRHFDRLASLADIPGCDAGDLFIPPTILGNVSWDSPAMRDEIFGPVVSVLPVKDMDEVIERANNTNYGLAAAIWTKNIDKAHNYARAVKAGTVWVNCYHIVDTTTPFGGF